MKTLGRNGKKHNSSSMRILPIIRIRESNKNLYPKNWNEKVKKYYKNLEQLL